MAVAPTGAIYKALTFDNTSSRNYGVYITGQAVYNAPQRDVEMISIPGRNGSLALDKGRFENIEVTYPAGIFADTEADFAQAVSDFRNFLCSKKGYCRLSDEYNPSEYRLAVYKSGLEVDPAQLRAGEFDITFECKPQRFLTSGETKTTVATSGSTITNPTLFDASPMLEATGYGAIGFNGSEIEIVNATIGQIQVLGGSSVIGSTSITRTYTLDLSQLNTGDSITVSKLAVRFTYTDNQHHKAYTASITSTSNATATATAAHYAAEFNVTCDDIIFAKGTSGSTTCTVGVSSTAIGGTTATGTEQIVVSYDGTDTLSIAITGATLSLFDTLKTRMTLPPVMGNSTVSTLGNPTYIDLDIGEAYNIENGTVISVNNSVQIPAELPTFAPGANPITYDNTITDLKVIPRWWRV